MERSAERKLWRGGSNVEFARSGRYRVTICRPKGRDFVLVAVLFDHDADPGLHRFIWSIDRDRIDPGPYVLVVWFDHEVVAAQPFALSTGDAWQDP